MFEITCQYPKWLKVAVGLVEFDSYELMEDWCRRRATEYAQGKYPFVRVKGDRMRIFFNKEKHNRKRGKRMMSWKVWMYVVPEENVVSAKQYPRHFEVKVRF